MAIEKVLSSHHSTSRQPMRLTQLRFRAFQNGTPVAEKCINEILCIWPDAYKVYTSKGQPVIEALDLPAKATEREEHFRSLWTQKENLAIKKPEPARTNPECRRALKPLLMRQLHTLSDGNKPLNLLDRIRAKEARLRAQRCPQAVKSARDTFVRSQVPKLIRVLSDLTRSQQHKSLDMETAMVILRTNLFRLSDEEITHTLEMVAQLYPTFCSIVRVGESEHLSLRSGVNV